MAGLTTNPVGNLKTARPHLCGDIVPKGMARKTICSLVGLSTEIVELPQDFGYLS